MVPVERTSREWFQEAARFYVEGHQGCAWCAGPYRVFKLQDGSKIEYYCHGCEFHTGHDPENQSYFSVPGLRVTGAAPKTMHFPRRQGDKVTR
jgi:hypothetical protein